MQLGHVDGQQNCSEIEAGAEETQVAQTESDQQHLLEADDHSAQTESCAHARRTALSFLKQHDPAIRAVLSFLLEKIAPVEAAASKKLLKRLSSTVNDGTAPSFSDAGARSGYVRRRLQHRAAQIGIALLHPQLKFLKASLQQEQSASFRVASVGGGPGSDAAGITLFRNFLGSKRPIFTHVLDVEDGWATTVDQLKDAAIDCTATEIHFKHCNVLLPLGDRQNQSFAAEVVMYDLVIFSFVLAENRVAMMETRMEFLRDMLALLGQRAAVLVLDCTYQIFEPITEVAAEHGWIAHRVQWQKDINGHCKNVLLLERKKGCKL